MLCCGNVGEKFEEIVETEVTDRLRSHSIRVLEQSVGPNMFLRHKRHRHVTLPEFASAIEHGILVWSERRSRQYMRKLYSIMWVIRKDPAIFRRFDPWDIAYVKEDAMTPDEGVRGEGDGGEAGGGEGGGGEGGRGPSSLESIRPKIARLEAVLKERVKAAMASTTKRKCKRCGSEDLERIALQLRSADEGMTTMMQCTSCSHRFR
jgi:DNA-directed RNA polymerase subunit M/transcription elongation factor TFIIS